MKRKVLIVEDDSLLAEAAADYFNGKGWLAETAGNGSAALERFRQEQFHLILLDVMMPGMNGFPYAVRSGKKAMFRLYS